MTTSAMIGYSVNGCPRPIGSEFRQRPIWAEAGLGEKRHVNWVVSAVETVGGTAIEARFHLNPNVLVAYNVASHSGFGLQDVLAKAVDALGDDDWKLHTVQACRVGGCENPLPMWAHSRTYGHGEPEECLSCRARTVLACVKCGMPDNAYTTGRERLLRDSLCFGCALWRERLAEGSEVVNQHWHTQSIRKGHGGPKEHKGYAGQEWVIRFNDGRVVETDDLWDGGVVPEWFRDRFTQNAVVHAKESAAERALRGGSQ